jgi:hypothetical protein
MRPLTRLARKLARRPLPARGERFIELRALFPRDRFDKFRPTFGTMVEVG